MITIKNLGKKFDDRIIFENVSCTLKNGNSYAIIGRSGAGKTTFLNILGGLEKATSGQVFVDDEEVNDKNLPTLRRKSFGFIFQNFGLIDIDTIEQNLSIGLVNQKVNKSDKLTMMNSVLKQLGLEKLSLKQKVYTLSGGEQQRIALARIILKKPSIVFADEPTGSLDPDNAQAILGHLLSDFDSNATILIATHDPNVWNKCDYIIKVKNKTIKILKNEGAEINE